MFYLSDGLRFCVVAVIDTYDVASPMTPKATVLFINVCLSAQLCVGIVAVADTHVTPARKLLKLLLKKLLAKKIRMRQSSDL